MECYINAADLNNAEAQNRAGMMFYDGQGTQQDNERAFKFIKNSAENGNVSAMGNLAIMYDRGRGTTKDYVLARKWYEAALENGTENFSAINNLGFLYLHGLGTAVDYDKAQMYFERAIQKGSEAAKDNLAELKKKWGEKSGKNVGRNSNTSTENQYKEVRWEPKNIIDEVRMMVMSCSSPPVVGTPEENARRVMKKIEYFRENGVEEHLLYELEGKILQFMPEFVAENFDEFFAFLKEDISAIYLTVHSLVEDGEYMAAKKIADPLATYLERHKAELLDGHHCHLNAFETALFTIEEKRVIPTPKAKDDYTAFLIDYVIILQNTRIVRNNQGIYSSGMEESRKYLQWILDLCPQNSAAWLYLGISYDTQEEKSLECYREALRYCYMLDDTHGLVRIYEKIALHYWKKNQVEVVAALKDLIVALNRNPFVLTILLKKQPTPEKQDFRNVLRKCNIQMGFSELAIQTAMFLEDSRAGVQDEWDIQGFIQDIKSARI